MREEASAETSDFSLKCMFLVPHLATHAHPSVISTRTHHPPPLPRHKGHLARPPGTSVSSLLTLSSQKRMATQDRREQSTRWPRHTFICLCEHGDRQLGEWQLEPRVVCQSHTLHAQRHKQQRHMSSLTHTHRVRSSPTRCGASTNTSARPLHHLRSSCAPSS